MDVPWLDLCDDRTCRVIVGLDLLDGFVHARVERLARRRHFCNSHAAKNLRELL
jgi:hypothetical protein